MDDAAEIPPIEMTTDTEMRELLGLFDAPAFVRRGQDLEYGLSRLHAYCRRQRESMLDMVRVRLRQWAAAVTGPQDWAGVFAVSIEPLWDLTDAEPPAWSDGGAPPRRRRAIARDLVASLDRFNRRWSRFVAGLDLQPINQSIDHYNHYYVLEKECCLGSPRLATRHFVPKTRVEPEDLLIEYPLLPVPELVG